MKVSDTGIWEAFYWVAKEKSFTRAAHVMKIGVPHLSKRIVRLEEELGARLFHRTTRRVSMTHEGMGLLPHVTSVLEDLRNLENKFEATDKVSGTIRMTAGVNVAVRLLAPAIVKFTEIHPEVKFDMIITERLVDLVEDQIDLAIRIDEPSDSSLIYKKLAPCRMMLVASPKYLKRTKMPLKKPKDLHDHPIILSPVLEDLSFVDKSYSFRDFDTRKIRSDNAMVTNALGLEGAGIALRGVWDVGPHLASGELVQVLPKHKIENFGDIYAVMPSRRFLTQRVRSFIDFLVEETSPWN